MRMEAGQRYCFTLNIFKQDIGICMHIDFTVNICFSCLKKMLWKFLNIDFYYIWFGNLHLSHLK